MAPLQLFLHRRLWLKVTNLSLAQGFFTVDLIFWQLNWALVQDMKAQCVCVCVRECKASDRLLNSADHC